MTDETKPTADPNLELMLEEAARDAAELRRQKAQVNLASGVLLVVVGAGIAIWAVVRYAMALNAARAGAYLVRPQMQLGAFGVTITFAVAIFAAGLWLAVRAMTE